ncbi:MAG: asparagine--tRNA ligase [Chloroflexia bacterium]|nr:asparagine--tRNA ligase [Chloroflexia bacterium]
MAQIASIAQIGDYAEQAITLRGWLYHKREKGKLIFLILRDGSGYIQGVVFEPEVAPETFEAAKALSQESSLIVRGTVRADERAPGGYELSVQDIQPVQIAEEYPITPKEHGIGFLMEQRHLWVRSSKQHALLRLRAEIEAACQEYLNERGFVRFDTPILTPCAAEGTSNLFSTQYFDLGPAYLAQTGQLYVEAGMMAYGKVYCFGPTFRAEKSKTRRHLTEFWMIEPEMAFYDHEDNLKLQEEYLSYIVQRCLERRAEDLEVLERDLDVLRRVQPPFPRITYDEVVELVARHYHEVEGCTPLDWGDDLGAPHEALVSQRYDKPVFVTHYPTQAKAFYMEPHPERPEVSLCADLLAPEGYGEIIGGSQRIHDAELLAQRIVEWGLRLEDYGWYVDLRRYGSVPHSGFGMGIERVVAWIAGIHHIRETIPFPRMLYRIYP